MILVDPLGLADRLAQGVPYIGVDRAADIERQEDAGLDEDVSAHRLLSRRLAARL